MRSPIKYRFKTYLRPTYRIVRDFFRPLYLCLRRLLTGEISVMEFANIRQAYFGTDGEDAFLDNYFRGQATGFYVDVGAFHPIMISNTHVFYKKGWRGINVEPNPKSFRSFPKYRSGDINLNVAIDCNQTEVLFNCCEAFSGIVGNTHLYGDYQERFGTTQCRVPAMTLTQVLDEHLPQGTGIDFLSVDCEGHDSEVLRSNDWSKYRPRVVLVEDHTGNQSDSITTVVDKFMPSIDYHLEAVLGITKVFVDTTYSGKSSLES